MRMKEALAEAYQGHAAVHKSVGQKHEALAREHANAEECHEGLAECMGKATGGDVFSKAAKHHEDLANHHGLMSEHHAALAKFHGDASDTCSGFAADCEKANAADLRKLQPDHISSIIPSDVPSTGFGIFAVPRRGQPTPTVNKAAVALEFQHLMGDNDDD